MRLVGQAKRRTLREPACRTQHNRNELFRHEDPVAPPGTMAVIGAPASSFLTTNPVRWAASVSHRDGDDVPLCWPMRRYSATRLFSSLTVSSSMTSTACCSSCAIVADRCADVAVTAGLRHPRQHAGQARLHQRIDRDVDNDASCFNAIHQL